MHRFLPVLTLRLPVNQRLGSIFHCVKPGICCVETFLLRSQVWLNAFAFGSALIAECKVCMWGGAALTLTLGDWFSVCGASCILFVGFLLK